MAHYPSLDELVDDIAALRPLSAVAMRIMELTESDRFSAHDRCALVFRDVAGHGLVTRRL